MVLSSEEVVNLPHQIGEEDMVHQLLVIPGNQHWEGGVIMSGLQQPVMRMSCKNTAEIDLTYIMREAFEGTESSKMVTTTPVYMEENHEIRNETNNIPRQIEF